MKGIISSIKGFFSGLFQGFTQAKNKALAGLGAVGLSGYVQVANAAPVELPATAQADIEGSVTNGGNLYLAVVLLILGFIVIGRMIKKT